MKESRVLALVATDVVQVGKADFLMERFFKSGNKGAFNHCLIERDSIRKLRDLTGYSLGHAGYLFVYCSF